MEYKIEELLPIVGRLAEEYTAFESTSVSYEKAEQLMEAVLYCIHEAEHLRADSPVPQAGFSAWKAYETGAAAVEEKTRAALELYHETLQTFDGYGNRCLTDTFQKGLPEFFRWYDAKFAPQETILTLDYPLLRDLSGQTGIDRIYGLIVCVRMEQAFLNGFPAGAVRRILAQYSRLGEDLVENLCEIVLTSLAGHILAGKPFSGQALDGGDYLQIGRVFAQEGLHGVTRRLEHAITAFIRKYYSGCDGLTEYLTGAVRDIAFRLKTAAEYCPAETAIISPD